MGSFPCSSNGDKLIGISLHQRIDCSGGLCLTLEHFPFPEGSSPGTDNVVDIFPCDFKYKRGLFHIHSGFLVHKFSEFRSLYTSHIVVMLQRVVCIILGHRFHLPLIILLRMEEVCPHNTIK